MLRCRVYLALCYCVGLTLMILLTVGAQAGAPAPAASLRAMRSSGWIDLLPNDPFTYTHNLGGDPAGYGIDVCCQDTRADGIGVNARALGTSRFGASEQGVFWRNLTAEHIVLQRGAQDVICPRVLVRLWQPTAPSWQGAWHAVAPDSTYHDWHNLGGDPDSYTVGLRLRDDDGEWGVHQYGLGGVVWHATEPVNRRGAAWERLTNERIVLYRYPQDQHADSMRVSIYLADPPIYDSGWITVTAGTAVTLSHGLTDTTGVFVRMEGRSAPLGINVHGLGGQPSGDSLYGYHWERLTDQSVRVVRYRDDTFGEQLRLRMWRLMMPAACVPVLVAPAQGAIMDNGRSDGKDFKSWTWQWEPCPAAEAYHLYVIGPTATIPMVDHQDLTTTEYTLVASSYIADVNRLGWRWRVRAQVNGEWGDWSAERTFDVEPVNTDPPQQYLHIPMVIKR